MKNIIFGLQMLGLQLFFHSLSLVFRNFDQALKLSIPLIIPWIIGMCVLQVNMPIQDPSVGGIKAIVLWGGFWGLCLSVGLVWTAVGWHRFVLLEQPQAGLLPRFHTQIYPYIWKSLLLGVALGFVFLLASPFAGSIGFALGGFWVSATLLFVVGALISWSFYLLSPILPAAALGQKMTFAEAWEQTEDFAGSIAIVAICYFAFQTVLNLVVETAIGSPEIIYYAILSVVSWVLAIVGISLLTTIYGVVIENREL